MDSNVATSQKLDVYAIVTNRIIELLEKGTVPWKQPWADAGMPMNLLSKRAYRGINLWLLLSLRYSKNLFLTWDQIKKLGASVKQREHGHVVVFWRTIQKKKENDTEDGPVSSRSVLRYYKVFNIEQCRDLPDGLLPASPAGFNEPIKACEDIISNMPDCPPIDFIDNHAYYHPIDDFINMPKPETFNQKESYYATLFHELVHSTGHEKRLNRKSLTQMAEFGSEPYSIEELVAELGAAYLCSSASILEGQIGSSSAYIKGWLTKLRNDKRFIMQSSTYAQRAVDLILGKQKNFVNALND